MKIKPLLRIALITWAFICTSCAQTDPFSPPSFDCTDPNTQPNTTIDNIYNLADERIRLYPGAADDVLTGIVISSDQGGNFYNKLYLVDEQTQRPLIINLELAASFVEFPPGTKILVKLDNLYCTNSFDKLTLGGGIYTSSKDKKYMGSIPKNNVVKHLEKYCEAPVNLEPYTHHLTLQNLKENTAQYTSTLLTLENVQFDPSLVGKKLYDPTDVDAQGYTLRKLIDNQGNACYIRTGKMSKEFVDYVIPANSGSITGILDVFSKQMQLYPRLLTDLLLDQDPLTEDSTTSGNGNDEEGNEDNSEDNNEGGNTDEDIPVEPGGVLVFPGADFEDWDAFNATLSRAGLKFATQAPGEGWNNSSALAFRGSPTKTEMAFIARDVSVPSSATAISFLMNGQASRRSLSIQVYDAAGYFVAYNLGDIQHSQSVLPSTHTNQEGNVNQYNGIIDTQGQWIKIMLPLSGVAYNQTGMGPFFAIRFGGKTATISSTYDLVIDEIRFEQESTE